MKVFFNHCVLACWWTSLFFFVFLATGGGESARERYWGHREQEPAVADVDYAVSNTADAEHQPLDHVSQRSHRRSCQRRSRSLSGGLFSCNFGHMALIHCILYVFQIHTDARSPHVLKYVYPLSQGCLSVSSVREHRAFRWLKGILEYLKSLACPKGNILAITTETAALKKE